MVGAPFRGNGPWPHFPGREKEAPDHSSRERWRSLTLWALRPESFLLPVFPPAENFCPMLMLSINEELQARLAQGLTGPSRAAPGPRAPESQLSPRSSASEVCAWLQAKGFSSG